jgi:hypothetical protein
MGENGINAHQIDGHGSQDVLHMGSGQSIVAGSSHPHSSHGLRKGAFNARTQRILLPKLQGLFHVSLRL